MPYNLILKEESPNNFVFEIREETFKSAFNLLKFMIPTCLILISLPIGLSYFKNASEIPSWLYSSATLLAMPCLIADSLIVGILVFTFQIPAILKALRPPDQSANFDLKTGFAKGVRESRYIAKTAPWELEINRVKSLTLGLDDPRFDLAELTIRGVNGAALHTFYGFREDMRQVGEKLSVWLGIPFEDNAPDRNWKAQNNS